MSARLEELDWQVTPMGVLSLRRRRDPLSGADIFEVKLDDEYLMSSLFTAAEVEVARLALAVLAGDSATGRPLTGLDVVVGGLGLGYTAHTVLQDAGVRELLVVEALAEVIGWHERGLLPASVSADVDARCRLVHADFFAAARSAEGFDPHTPGRRFDAVIVDIDHSPRHLLHPRHAGFYRPDGVRQLAGHLRPGGVFALWSNDPPDADYEAVLGSVLVEVRAEVVRFPNPLQGGESTNTVYLGRART